MTSLANPNLRLAVTHLRSRGWSVAKLAKHFSLTTKEMADLVDALMPEIERDQLRRAKAAIDGYIAEEDLAEQALQRIRDAIQNPNHREGVTAAWRLLERVRPALTDEATRAASPTHAAVEGLGKALGELAQLQKVHVQVSATLEVDPHITEGEATLVHLEPAPAPTLPANTNGSSDPHEG